MYESPVQVWEDVTRICEEITKAKEEYVFSQIRAVVDVDKEELLKALQYDRQQYEKGYSDGRAARDEEIVRCKGCRHTYHDGNQLICLKLYWCDSNNFEPSAEDFCSLGERRE